MEYTCIYKKETQMNVGEGNKVKKTSNDLAEKEGRGMGDRSKERKKW